MNFLIVYSKNTGKINKEITKQTSKDLSSKIESKRAMVAKAFFRAKLFHRQTRYSLSETPTSPSEARRLKISSSLSYSREKSGLARYEK